MPSVHPSALPEGYCELIEDGRLGDGTLRARWGDLLVKASVATGSFRGACSVLLGGVQTLFAAYADSSLVTVYRSTDSGATWASVTPSSGPYGDTRLTDTGEPVRYVVVRDRALPGFDAHDLLVVQNGTDAPRILGTAATGSTAFAPGAFGCAKVVQPEAPSASYLSAFFTLDKAVEVRNTAATSFSNSDATKLEVLDGGVMGLNYVDFKVKATVDAAASGTVILATPLDLTGRDQIIFVVSGPSTTFWDDVRIDFGDGTNSATIYGNGVQGPFKVAVENPFSNTFFQIGCPIPSSGVNISSVSRFTFYWTGTAPGGTLDAAIYVIAGGGTLSAGTLFGVSYGSTDARQVSAPTLAVNTRFSLSSYGASSVFDGVRLSGDERFKYNFQIQGLHNSNAQRNAGVDRAYVWANTPGSTGYFYAASERVSSWGGASWAYDDSGAGLVFPTTLAASVTNTVSTVDPAPDGANICLQTGKAMAMANGRLFLGQGSRLWFSEFDNPFRFRKAVRFTSATQADPLSGGSMLRDGETVEQIVPIGSLSSGAESLSSPLSGTSTIHVLTSRSLFALSGFDSTSLSRPVEIMPHGTSSPFSVARSKYGFYWLDDEMQVRYYGADGQKSLSFQTVDVLTKAIPANRRVWATGAVQAERYYLGYTPSGSTNIRALVYNEAFGTWEGQDGCSPTAEGFVLHSGRLFRFGTTDLYEHAKDSQTGTVNLFLKFREETLGYMNQASPARASFVVDPVASNLTFTTTFAFSDGTDSIGSATYPSSTGRRKLYAPDSIGGEGDAFQLRFFSSIPAGTRLHAAHLELSPRPFGGIAP